MKKWGPYFLKLILLTGWGSLHSCSSSDVIGLDDWDQENQAPGSAYVVDSMQIRKPMLGHKDWHPWEFYFKHCSLTEEETYYSKTSYVCNDPF